VTAKYICLVYKIPWWHTLLLFDIYIYIDHDKLTH